MQNQCFIEVASFNDFARFVCALREYPLRTYTHYLNGKRVISSGMTLSNTLVLFYTSFTKKGRYLSYSAKGGKEYCDVVNSAKDIFTYAPIIHLDSQISPLKIMNDNLDDQFYPIKLKDLGSLARLTYDPHLPDEPSITLFAVPHKNNWYLGYLTSLEMDNVVYLFNYVKLKEEPNKPFLKYLGGEGKESVLSSTFEHGYPYLPIIKLKQSHSLFGFHSSDNNSTTASIQK